MIGDMSGSVLSEPERADEPLLRIEKKKTARQLLLGHVGPRQVSFNKSQKYQKKKKKKKNNNKKKPPKKTGVGGIGSVFKPYGRIKCV
jgi:hypothetical protein